MWINKNINLMAGIIVGLTFVFSGVTKLNDPVGFANKIEEYFHVLAIQFMPRLLVLLPYTLVLAVFIATLEAVLGIALLINFQTAWTLRVLLLLTLFFTALTFYTATQKRLASCGCFGDALSLTPWQSFAKSVVLLLLLGVLHWQKRAYTWSPSNSMGYYWIAATLLSALGLSWYSINHLPIIDFRPYKVGNNLHRLTKPDAPLRYVYVLEKEGEIIETEDYPQDTRYKLLATKLLNPEAEPLITNFNIWRGTKDCTDEVLAGDKLLIIAQHAQVDASKAAKLQALIKQLKSTTQPVLISSLTNAQSLADALQLSLHTTDATLLKTMVRAKLGLLLLRNGMIVGKWHYNDLNHTKKTLARLDLLQ